MRINQSSFGGRHRRSPHSKQNFAVGGKTLPQPLHHPSNTALRKHCSESICEAMPRGVRGGTEQAEAPPLPLTACGSTPAAATVTAALEAGAGTEDARGGVLNGVGPGLLADRRGALAEVGGAVAAAPVATAGGPRSRVGEGS